MTVLESVSIRTMLAAITLSLIATPVAYGQQMRSHLETGVSVMAISVMAISVMDAPAAAPPTVSESQVTGVVDVAVATKPANVEVKIDAGINAGVGSEPPEPMFIAMANVGVLAQNAGAVDLAPALLQAELDARNQISGALWFGAGCLLGLIGVVLGYVISPTPPAAAMIGKAPDYVIAYSSRYQQVGKQK